MGEMKVVMVTYVLIGLYATLTGSAGVIQWKETGFQVRSFLFVLVSTGMLVTLFLPNKNMMFALLIMVFLVFHILAIMEGLKKKGRLTYSHHLVRFLVHLLFVALVFKYIN